MKHKRVHKGKRNPMFGKKHSEESKKKMSKTRREKIKCGKIISPNLGKSPKRESVLKMVRTRMRNNSYLHKEKTKRKISNSLRGRKPWNVGISPSKETRRRLSISGKGKKCSDKVKRILSERMRINNPSFGGLSEEHKMKISKKLKGRTSPIKGMKQNKEWIEKGRLSRIGKKRTKETKEKMSKTRKELIRQGKIVIIFPKEDTSIEIKVQNFLKDLGIDFFTHQYMKISHGYRCDILIPSMNLVIECDGNYWHKYPIGNELDHIRTKELLEKGFKVLRLWEFEIKEMNISQFKRRIKNEI